MTDVMNINYTMKNIRECAKAKNEKIIFLEDTFAGKIKGIYIYSYPYDIDFDKLSKKEKSKYFKVFFPRMSSEEISRLFYDYKMNDFERGELEKWNAGNAERKYLFLIVSVISNII